MSEIQVIAPRISTNDNYVVIGEWLVESGAAVKKGDELASLETTKKTEVLEAEADGYFFFSIEEGEEVEVGEPVGVISDNADFAFEKKGSSLDEYNMTNKARELVIKHNVDLTKFDKNSIIREKDVLKILSKGFEVERSKANDILIFGGGGLAKMLIDLIRLNKSYNIHGVIDTYLEPGTMISGVPVIGTEDDLPRLREEGYMTCVNAIGSISADNAGNSFFIRKNITRKIKEAGFFMPTLIHPTASVATSAQLGEGVIVMEHATIGPDAIIADDALINTGAIVSHDCVIGKHCRISPGAILAGDIKVGENALIGMGATLYLGITVGENAVISNGQNVFRNVNDNEIIQ